MKFRKIIQAIIKEFAFFLPFNGHFRGSAAVFPDKLLAQVRAINPGNPAVIFIKLHRQWMASPRNLCTGEPNKFVLLYALFKL